MSKAPREDTTEVSTIQTGLPAEMMEDMAQYSGAGISERAQDFAFPFLAIAQSGSPQVKRQQADKYIEGLEVGDVFNTATRKFWRTSRGEAIKVVPVWFAKAWVEWVPRTEGGGGGQGYVATHEIDSGIEKQARRGGPNNRDLLLPNGHQLVDTSYHFVLDMEGSAFVVGMTSTGLQASRTWQTLMKEIKIPHAGGLVIAPCFARIYELRTVWKKNDQGDWWTWNVSDAGWNTGPLYALARDNFKAFSENPPTLGRPPLDDAETSADLSGETPI